MKFSHKMFLAILSGSLLGLSWPSFTLTTPLVFVALVPLFMISESCASHRQRFFIYPFVAFLVWNVSTLSWIYYASPFGAVSTFVLNALLMSVPYMLFFSVYVQSKIVSFVALVGFWMSFEYLHFYWDLSFPWLTLGHVFAAHPRWIQWYEYTGVAGGTLWVLLVNIGVYMCLYAFRSHIKYVVQRLLAVGCLLLLPLVVSLYLYYTERQKLSQHDIYTQTFQNVVVVQPNIETYTQKFLIPEKVQVDTFLSLMAQSIDSNTVLALLPETALVNSFWEYSTYANPSIQALRKFQDMHPNLYICVGASTLAPKSSIPSSDALVYEYYNTALWLRPLDNVATFYHKSRLVPGVEKMPFQKYLSFLDALMINLGGTNVGLGVQDTPSVFVAIQASHLPAVSFAPLVCYESIYGTLVSDFVQRGAQALLLITNDGWWQDSDGYKEHALYAQLRAIETRRYLYRSANTGVSLVLSPLGERLQEIDWAQKGVLKSPLILSKRLTFYVQHKDYLYQGMFFIALFVAVRYWVVSLFVYLRKYILGARSRDTQKK